MSQQNNKNEYEKNEPIRSDFEDFDVNFEHDDASNDDFTEVVIQGRDVITSSGDEYLDNVVLASGMASLQSERFRSKTRSYLAAQKAMDDLERQSLQSRKQNLDAVANESLSEGTENEEPTTLVHEAQQPPENSTEAHNDVPAEAILSQEQTPKKEPFQLDEKDENSDKRRHHYSNRSHSRFGRKWRKLKKWQRAIIIILLALFVMVLAAVLTVFIMHQSGKKATMAENYGDNFQSSIFYNGVEYLYNTDMTSIAFMGVDKRTFGTENEEYGFSGQSDVNMVLSIDTKTGKSSVIVLPRDTLVDVDKYSISGDFMGTQKQQLCLAYAFGDGKQTSCDNTIVSMQRILYGIPINTYVALNLDGIAPLNDALGGVTVTCPNDFADLYTKGETITLTGNKAERFIRARDDDLEGDAERRERQIAYVKSYVSQAAQSGLKNPNLLREIYQIGSGYTVSNLTLSRSLYFGTTILSNPSEIMSFNNIQSLKGELQLSDSGYATTILDEDKTLETILSIYYTPLQ